MAETPKMKNFMGWEVCDQAARDDLETFKTSTNNEISNIKTEVRDIEHGGTGASTAKNALNNLGITWGTEDAPATGEPNTIYIQIS